MKRLPTNSRRGFSAAPPGDPTTDVPRQLYKRRKANKGGLAFRALFKVLYYCGLRPESEACALRHGDVELPDRSKVRTLDGRVPMGRVHVRDSKTRQGDRTIALHPEAEDDLRRIMLPRPADPEESEEWEQHPIFPRRGLPMKPMTKDSYKKAWQTAVEKAAKEHPEIRGMIARDLRKVFRTTLTYARVSEAVTRRLMGHAVNVSQSYCELTDEAAEEAIRSLSLVRSCTQSRTLARQPARQAQEPASTRSA